MLQYKKRPGIVLENICGVHVLIPTRAAYKDCPTLRTLPLLWAATWDLIGKDDAEYKIMRLHKILTKKPDQEIEKNCSEFFEYMEQAGFIIKDQK